MAYRFLRRPFVIAVVSTLALALGTAAEEEPRFSLSESPTDSTKVIFIGHYAEKLELDDRWTADVDLVDSVETVRFHPTTTDFERFSAPPFNPSKESYVPENFRRMRLMEMRVLPKGTPGWSKSLEEFRTVREAELAALGAERQLSEVGLGPWPLGSFQVSISKPYRLFQVYSQSPKYFFILTSGSSPYEDLPYDEARSLFSELRVYLNGFKGPVGSVAMPLADIHRAFIPALVVCGIAAFLCLFPALPRIRLFGQATLLLIVGWHITTMPLMLLAWRLGWGRYLNEASLVALAVLATPWISRAATARLTGDRSWRSFEFSAAASLMPLVISLIVWAGIHEMDAPVFYVGNFLRYSRALSLACLLNGIAFALASRPNVAPPERSAP